MTRRSLLASARSGSQTLRFRLMLWNAGVVLVTALLVLAGLREGVRLALVRELDVILLEDLEEMRLALAAAPSADDPRLLENLNRRAAGHQAHRWFVRFLDRQGQSVWVSFNGPHPMTPVSIPPGTPAEYGKYRLVQEQLTSPHGEVAAIRVGASTEMIDANVGRLDRLVGIAVAILFVAAPLCGFWIAGRMLRPIAGIIDTASRLRPDRMDERLPHRGTGDELDKLAETVNRLLDRTASYLSERRKFLANSAHELRSPLAAMRSTVEVWLQSGRATPEDEETLSVIIDQCRSLEYVVNQLLLLAETEAEQFINRSEEVSLDQLVATAGDMFVAAAETKGVTLRIVELVPTVVRGNRNRLRQVINNLFDNAVKFTSDGDVVSISLRHSDDGGTALLTVSDTGPGIATNDLPHVFDRFFRGDRSRHRDGLGTGLGLSICRAVVAAHGGTISIESEVGAGTVAHVSLPVAPVSQAALKVETGSS